MKVSWWKNWLSLSLLGFASIAYGNHGHGGGGHSMGGGHHMGGGGHHMSAPSHHFSAPSHHMSVPSHHFSAPSTHHLHHSPAGTFNGSSAGVIQHHHSAGSSIANQIHGTHLHHSGGSTIANQINSGHLHHHNGSNLANQVSANHHHTPAFVNQHFHHHPGGTVSGNNTGNWTGHHVTHHHHPHYWNNNSYFFGIGSPFGSYFGPRYGVGYGGFGYGLGIGYGYGGYGYGGLGYGGLGYGYGGYPGYYGYGTRYGVGYPCYAYRPTCTYVTAVNSYATPTAYLAASSGAFNSLPATGIIATQSAAQIAQNTVVQVPAATSTSGTSNPTALDYAGRGEQEFKAGNYKQAAKLWRHALVEDPGNAAYVLLLGQALFATGDFDESAGATQQAALMLPQENWDIVVKNYRQLYTNIGDYTTQLRALEKARTEKPESPALRFLLGWHYGYLGYPKESMKELDKLLELAPTDEIGKKLKDQLTAKLPKDEKPVAPAPATEGSKEAPAKDSVEKKDV